MVTTKYEDLLRLGSLNCNHWFMYSCATCIVIQGGPKREFYTE